MDPSNHPFSPEFKKSYRPIRLLGEGAMGSVYLMHHVALNTSVAVKFIRSGTLSDVDRARFLREARILAALDHPNIMSVLDMGMDGKTPYLVCEFVDGGSLSDRMLQKPGLTPQQGLKIVAQLLSALKAAHRQEIIHRDVKPANIFLTANLKVKLGDFGLAKPLQNPSDDGRITVTGAIVGTPSYMSPEQCRGFPASVASDLYAVGIVLFEVLTGSRPFPGPNLLDYLLQQTNHVAPPVRSIRPELPAELDELVRRALEKNPEARPAGAHEFRQEILAAARLLAPPAPDSPDRLLDGRYRLERPVGEGWLGQVFLARDEELEEVVAIKVLRPVAWRDPEVQSLIKQAVKGNQKLAHENIVRILGLERDGPNGEPTFLVTGFVAGASLDQELERRSAEGNGPLTPAEALPLVTAIASALSHAHRAGCLHMGLRPSNVLLEDPRSTSRRREATGDAHLPLAQLRPRLTDFGFNPRASMLSTRPVPAAPSVLEAFMSPEQQAGEPLDERSDVYSLGVLVHQVLTLVGVGTMASNLTELTPPSGARPARLTSQMTELLAKSRARDKQDRPRSVEEFLARYRAAAEEPTPPTVIFRPEPVAPPDPVDDPPTHGTGRKLLLFGGLAGLLLWIAWSLGGTPQRDPERSSSAAVSAEPSSPGSGLAALPTGQPASPSASPTGQRPKDPARLLEWLRQSAEQGSSRAQFELAQRLESSGRTADSVEAGARYRQAAEQGNLLAQVKLGTLFLSGRGVTRDAERAAEWFRKAAEAGDAAGQWNLAELLASGRGVAKDDVQALSWYRAAANQGDPLGQCGVGLMYETGRGVALDPAAAYDWYKRAADKGNPTGVYHVGLCYFNGVGVGLSASTAIDWLTRAADLRHVPAELALGLIYAKGSHIPQDLTKALAWLERAAAHDEPEAQFLLAMMYLEGAGTRADRTRATRWFEAAAKLRHPRARAWLEKNGDSH